MSPVKALLSVRLVARRVRVATALLLAATVVCVPPLVRATARLGVDASSPLRLNRGFNAPPAKCTVVPPADVPFRIVHRLADPPREQRIVVPGDEPLPHSTPRPSADPLRGPPPVSLS